MILGPVEQAGISQLTQLRPRGVGKAESMQPQVVFVHLKFYRVSVKSGNIDNVLFFSFYRLKVLLSTKCVFAHISKVYG